ncbi:MAG: A/G-specific adenine glycosylase, partial [Chloroflexia bacterium]|nr:A/G-specific adenine glycosylase [Chloroflexia bacterium]
MIHEEAAPPTLDAEKLAVVREELLGWWHANRRDLPWRHTRDPYRILVSEVMLQQTQVDRVIPYYERWLDHFPTVEALAAATTAELIRAWAGLGYNRRAVNLQRTARHVVEVCGGEFPREVEALRQLPGIGPYTAGAIACFAFELDTAFVDTNMRRVLHRLFVGVDV